MSAQKLYTGSLMVWASMAGALINSKGSKVAQWSVLLPTARRSDVQFHHQAMTLKMISGYGWMDGFCLINGLTEQAFLALLVLADRP